MTSLNVSTILAKDVQHCNLQQTKTFQINEYIQTIYNKHSLECLSGTLKEGCICTIQLLKVLPYHLKIKNFEYLNLDYLVKILKINPDSDKNIEAISAAKQLIYSRLKNFLPKKLLQECNLEDILDLLHKLYSFRKNQRYRLPSLESFNNVQSFTEFLDLLEQSPLIMLEIFKEFLCVEIAILELDYKIILQWSFICLGPCYSFNPFLKQIFIKCLFTCIKSNNINMLNIFNRLELEKFTNEHQPEFWLLLKQNYSKDFVEKFLEILFGYPHLNIQDAPYRLSALRNFILLLIKVSDFKFIQDILLKNPNILKNDARLLSKIKKYRNQYLETKGSHKNSRLLVELHSIYKLLS